jgi:hypothetical protein
MNASDLDRMDRVTLRAWRAGNVVGWWLVGAAVGNVGGVLLERLLFDRLQAGGWQTPLLGVAISLFVSATAGWIVGRHVYREPEIVAAAAVLFPGGLYILFALLTFRSWDAAVVLLFLIPPTATAIGAARIAWRGRPRALRMG